MSKIKEDKYKIKNAQVCIRCEQIRYEKSGGIRGYVCQYCWDELNRMFKHWQKHGLYGTPSNPHRKNE